MRRKKRILTWLAAMSSLGWTVGCDRQRAEAPAGEASTSRVGGRESSEVLEVPRVGVTRDGETIVFAGAVARSQAPQAPRQDRLVREPTEPDPEGGDFTLEEAVAGMPIDGQLVAEVNTDLGTIFCDLYADRVPRSVAHFVGLARGRRAWWDARAGIWRREPAYRSTTFHRVIPGYVIQGGDYLGDGSGAVGFTVPHEPHPTLSHDRAGRLAIATAEGPDTGGAQFYITDGAAPQLDGTATIIGQCRPEDVVATVARVPQNGSPENRPLTPVRIARVLIQRVVGGAAEARITTPRRMPGEPEVGRGASPDPAAIQSLEGLRRRRQEADEQLRQQPIPPR